MGDLEYTALHCDESCSLVNDIKPAAQIVRDIVREAEQAIGEMSAEYSAQLSRAAAGRELPPLTRNVAA